MSREMVRSLYATARQPYWNNRNLVSRKAVKSYEDLPMVADSHSTPIVRQGEERFYRFIHTPNEAKTMRKEVRYAPREKSAGAVYEGQIHQQQTHATPEVGERDDREKAAPEGRTKAEIVVQRMDDRKGEEQKKSADVEVESDPQEMINKLEQLIELARALNKLQDSDNDGINAKVEAINDTINELSQLPGGSGIVKRSVKGSGMSAARSLLFLKQGVAGFPCHRTYAGSIALVANTLKQDIQNLL